MEAVSGAFLAGWIVLNFPSFPIDTRFDERFGGDEPIDGACTFTCEMIPALAKAVEKYVKDLETLDELRAEQRAELRS